MDVLYFLASLLILTFFAAPSMKGGSFSHRRGSQALFKDRALDRHLEVKEKQNDTPKRMFAAGRIRPGRGLQFRSNVIYIRC